ncbi:protein phosphatase 2C domain-containing protein [Nocardia beijingensis]|uniref:protein phosphatase 2C domain-containing protein n=1 Tax=Nocardia beijingensis TaxID=95162 RepID=UPI00189310F5|nr:protein phosphatase 2C domain-containing protein [Nocardia beijingensis]MBF6079263.1 protein phosphatase 2C domain-containing protein [Nocardia beijingensis]
MKTRFELRSAQLPGSSNEDRIYMGANAVVVLDGATSHRPSEGPTGGQYAECLGAALIDILSAEPHTPALAVVLEEAIRRTVATLHLPVKAKVSPSCTVAIARHRCDDDVVDLLLLGDSTVVVGRSDGTEQVVTDGRMSQLDLPESREYKSRLRRGYGYDDTHRAVLGALQQAEQLHRNEPDGYWIASTDPLAARHAVSFACDTRTLQWVILATDGAVDGLASVGLGWQEVAAAAGDPELLALLQQAAEWESGVDPHGLLRPRSKRHDDKTVAVVRF